MPHWTKAFIVEVASEVVSAEFQFGRGRRPEWGLFCGANRSLFHHQVAVHAVLRLQRAVDDMLRGVVGTQFLVAGAAILLLGDDDAVDPIEVRVSGSGSRNQVLEPMAFVTGSCLGR